MYFRHGQKSTCKTIAWHRHPVNSGKVEIAVKNDRSNDPLDGYPPAPDGKPDKTGACPGPEPMGRSGVEQQDAATGRSERNVGKVPVRMPEKHHVRLTGVRKPGKRAKSLLDLLQMAVDTCETQVPRLKNPADRRSRP